MVRQLPRSVRHEEGLDPRRHCLDRGAAGAESESGWACCHTSGPTRTRAGLGSQVHPWKSPSGFDTRPVQLTMVADC
jgi:hypothetical protein